MKTSSFKWFSGKWVVWFFVLIQVGVMLLAISSQSLWFDELYSADFHLIGNLKDMLEQLLFNPQFALVPLHYLYYYFWEIVFQPNEMGLRLANLPLFVMGQLSLFWALRAYSKRFGLLLLALCALHPMVWQYANEARQYIMMYAGSEMILAYILHIHTIQSREDGVSPLFSAIFVFGSILLFGASMLGGFWVFAASAYVAYFHYRHLNWSYLKQGTNILLMSILLSTLALLSFMILRSLHQGGTTSKISPTTGATLLFDAYELIGLSGVGPGRLALREAGIAALGTYWIWLAFAGAIIFATLLKGFQNAVQLFGRKEVIIAVMVGLLPIAIVVLSGFAMHWRVLGRHLIAALPVLNILFAFGLDKLFDKNNGHSESFCRMIGLAFLLLLIYSSLSMRFAVRHSKDDYRGAAVVAQQEFAQGKQVWWAADSLGANYYGLPVTLDGKAIFDIVAKPRACADDGSGMQLVAGASKDCLESLPVPNVVILSNRREVFDSKGDIISYLNAHGFAQVQSLQAFTIWRPLGTLSALDYSSPHEIY